MGRLSVAALLVVAACQRAPARIYTDEDIAKLEARVLAKVAETDASCSHPELLEFTESLDADCHRAFIALKPRANPESNEVAAVDELCGPTALAAFGRAVLGSPSCSPYQVGVRGDPPVVSPGHLTPLFLAHLLSYHALRELDPYVGMTELLVGLRVSQDLARGRIDLIQLMLATAMEERSIGTAEKLLARSSMTKEQLDDIAATLDAEIESEPRLADALQGEALSAALHFGVAGLKPKDWQPPGGRGELTSSNEQRPSTEHDWRDDRARMMDVGLHRAETYAKACPSNASLATCSAGLPELPGAPDPDPHATDRHAARVAVFPDDETRHDSQHQLVLDDAEHPLMRDCVRDRARMVTALVALRLHVQVLRDGRCPSETQLAAPPYSTLRAPSVLGDAVPVRLDGASLTVDKPAWVGHSKYAKFEPVAIACP